MKTVFAVTTIGSSCAIILSLTIIILIFHDINDLYTNVMMEMEEFKVSFQDHLKNRAKISNGNIVADSHYSCL